ncbi:MAG: ribonuclease P protein component [Pirellulales bacterium]|nr:ribonuclease P protein component [Pirellulales bacterium]
MSYQFSKEQRIIRSEDFAHILARGSCAADATLVLFAIANEQSLTPRLGVTVPKRTGNAVQRNRWKRLIRESFRTQIDKIPSGFDFVVRPKKGAIAAWQDVQKSVPLLARKAAKRWG